VRKKGKERNKHHYKLFFYLQARSGERDKGEETFHQRLGKRRRKRGVLKNSCFLKKNRNGRNLKKPLRGYVKRSFNPLHFREGSFFFQQ